MGSLVSTCNDDQNTYIKTLEMNNMVPRTRREALAAMALTASAGCITTPFGESKSTFDTRVSDGFPIAADTDEWALPHYDSGHTRYTPSEAAPSGTDLHRHWRRPTPENTERAAGLAVANGRCYTTFERYDRRQDTTSIGFHVVDADNGDVIWQQTMGEWQSGFSPIYGPLPAVGAEMLWFGEISDGREQLTAVAASTGERQWSVPTSTMQTAIPTGQLLHIGRRQPDGGDNDHEAVAVDPLSGEPVWETALSNSPGYPASDGTDLFYPISDHGRDSPGQIVKLDPETGEHRGAIDATVQSMPVVADGRLYSSGWASRRLVALETETGSVAWERDVRFNHEFGDRGVNARYLFGGVTEDRLIVLKHMHGIRSDELWALDPVTGDTEWDVIVDPSDPVTTFNRPLVAGSKLFVTGTESPKNDTREGFVTVFDLESGELLARQKLPSACFMPPVVAASRLFVVCQEDILAFS